MIDKLQAIFPSLVRYQPENNPETETYQWYLTDDNQIIGIPEHELTNNEVNLLKTFLTPYQFTHSPMNQQELAWMDILFKDEKPDKLLSKPFETYRFIYFYLSEANIDQDAFREAIEGFYPDFVPILWENGNKGVIIEEGIQEEESGFTSYQQITDLLMSDFYMKVHLFVSPMFPDLVSAHTNYQRVKDWFHTAHKYNKNPVLTHVDAIPYLILDQTKQEKNCQIVTSVFQDTIDDKELLTTIQTFLECNSNATLAAKELYMHRNSLQYRVDKFIEKTGIDVKQFKGAITVYLALMLKQKTALL
ncbi:PucR family transcriptional regulator [Sediminibacillus albus]|uniref:PucR C-terminal helix-turn-helix domain-containing protein n=1 Tax=Sediminibacillus albus TaxID=407036 RepID=A0A1G8XHI2_9BACI|nr:helix-turn-helix domain-containing protein [Sediminibacillus albus]SDJ89230.1 PucR C-terminal helix-turn-helix domain-containing protein [Sediminibacillus albus]